MRPFYLGWGLALCLTACQHSNDDCSPSCGEGEVCRGDTCWVVCVDTDGCAVDEYCDEGVCLPTACGDGVKNGNESDVDCGGACASCAVGMDCQAPADCATGVCAGRCSPATCFDEVANGSETDVDCGGPLCVACADRKACGGPDDCLSQRCETVGDAMVCASCADERSSGDETDVDCGGSICGACDSGDRCNHDDDCEPDNTCDEGECNRCGDGVPRDDEIGEPHAEVCDDGNTLRDACTYGLKSCTVCGPTCDFVNGIPSYCSDNLVDTDHGEECDDGDNNSNNWAVNRHCALDCSGWSPGGYCGDGIAQTPEECGEPGLSVCSAAECAGCQCVDDPPGIPQLEVAFGVKVLQFSWTGVRYVNYYRLMEDPDGSGAYTQVGTNLTTTGVDHFIPVHFRAAAQYKLEAWNGNGFSASDPVAIGPQHTQAIGFLKASNPGNRDWFGAVSALSADGTTLAVSAYKEDSNATGVNAQGSDTDANESGAVYVFVRTDTGWEQQAYIKASNTGADDNFGAGLALSGNGDTLAVGASTEDSNATGAWHPGDVVGNHTYASVQADNGSYNSGAVYVFTRAAGNWSQQAYVKATNTGNLDYFGVSVALSEDGDTMAVGAWGENSAYTGIYHPIESDYDAAQANNDTDASGAAYVFTRDTGRWSPHAYLKASTAGAVRFASDVALSGYGDKLAASATWDGTDCMGAVYAFTRVDNKWRFPKHITPIVRDAYDYFGSAIALDRNGDTLAVASEREDSSATGVGDVGQTNNDYNEAGAAYVFTQDGPDWSQHAYVKASNTGIYDYFASSIALSADGEVLAVGAVSEDSGSAGINGDDSYIPGYDNAGAVYVYTRSGASWVQRAFVKASNPALQNGFGASVGLSEDGGTLAAGAIGEATTVSNSGAVYLY